MTAVTKTPVNNEIQEGIGGDMLCSVLLTNKLEIASRAALARSKEETCTCHALHRTCLPACFPRRGFYLIMLSINLSVFIIVIDDVVMLLLLLCW